MKQSRFYLYATLISLLLAGNPSPSTASEKNKTDQEKQPLEITADTLEVFKEKNQAIFSGNVKALQGQTHLNADRMTVYYSEQKEEKPATQRLPNTAPVAGNSSIKKIDVDGNVFLATPEETAQGKRGDYTLATGIINLYESVVLTREKNVITGDRLVHNRNTGISKIFSNDSQTKNAGSSSQKTRVKGIFIPENDAAQKKK